MHSTHRIRPKPKLLPKRRKGFCQHVAVYVVEHNRSLECRKCGAVVSPYDYLMRIAKRQESIDLNVKRLIKEEKKLTESVEELKRQRKNLRAQVKRLQEKAQ